MDPIITMEQIGAMKAAVSTLFDKSKDLRVVDSKSERPAAKVLMESMAMKSDADKMLAVKDLKPEHKNPLEKIARYASSAQAFAQTAIDAYKVIIDAEKKIKDDLESARAALTEKMTRGKAAKPDKIDTAKAK